MTNNFLDFINNKFQEQICIPLHIYNSKIGFKYSSTLSICELNIKKSKNKTYILLYGDNGEELNIKLDDVSFNEKESGFVFDLYNDTKVIFVDIDEI